MEYEKPLSVEEPKRPDFLRIATNERRGRGRPPSEFRKCDDDAMLRVPRSSSQKVDFIAARLGKCKRSTVEDIIDDLYDKLKGD